MATKKKPPNFAARSAMRIFDDERAAAEAKREYYEIRRLERIAKRAKYPRCVCGCGQRALWPQPRKGVLPIFNTRLCGYIHALKAIDKAAWKVEYDYRESLKRKNRQKPPPRRPPGRRKRIPA